MVREKINTLFELNHLDYLIIFGTGNICYTTGFESAIVNAMNIHILNKEECKDLLVLQFGFDLDLAALTYAREKITSTHNFSEFINKKIEKNSVIGVVGKEFITYDIYMQILDKAVTPIDVSESFKSIRLIKTEYEVEMIRSACELTEEALKESYKLIKEGVTEREIASYFEYWGNSRGGALAFSSSVAFGENTKYVAWFPTKSCISNNSPIFYDVGLRVNKYCADIGRTLFLGKPTDLYLEKYAQMKLTLETINAMIKPGLRATDLHKRALKLFDQFQLGELRHRIGHGCGIETSTEGIDLMRDEHLILMPSMVICTEVSMSYDNQWGIKIEDVILITETGFEVLSKSSKELVIIN